MTTNSVADGPPAPGHDAAYRWTAGRGGWVRVDLDSVPGPLWLRLSSADGRWFVSELYLDGRGAELTAGMLRAVAGFPAAVVGALIDGGAGSERFAALAGDPGPDLSRLAGYALAPALDRWAPRMVRQGLSGWALDSLRAQLPPDRQQRMFGETVRQAPAFPDPDPRRRAARRQGRSPGQGLDETTVGSVSAEPPAPLGGRIDAEFLRAVAAHHRWAVANRLRPGPQLAKASNVSLRTAQNWVYLARKSGALGRTKPGRVN